MTRVYLHTFGCKANQYDTEVVRQALGEVGVDVVDVAERADAAVINSCTVTHVADAKMRGLVRRLARRRPGMRTVVMGCAAARDDGTIASLPGVARVVGGADVSQVLLGLGLDAAPPTNRALARFARGSRAWLRIQDGCDEHCTFCATTLARGANRSRALEDIVTEAKQLAEWHAEIVLTGVHIGTYGRDLERRATLGTLVERLIVEVPDIRFRLSSVEATEVCDQLAELLVGDADRLAPHLHAPLQSGSDRVLKRMGRHWYTAGAYRERIEALAARLPVFGLGADVIVGFPGETAADHAETVALVRDLPFTYLHVFPYSERPDAAAQRLGAPVDPARAKARSAELRAIAEAKGAAYAAERDGGRADVVTTGHRRRRVEGLTGDYLTVYLPEGRVPSARFAARLATRRNGLVAEPLVPVGEPS